MREREEKRV